ncbi:MAG: GIY-YIG nuclease family protein [bacterium]
MEAHQYKIRVEKSKTENIDFDIKDVDLKKSKIKLIDKSTASKIILEYEWLGTMPYITRYHFGIYFNVNGIEHLGGVLTFGDDYAENTGVWNKYGFEDKLLLLNRGVCLWWTPKNTASYFISRIYNWIKKNTKYRIITATVDPMAGEIGTIYQSLNWHYVGLMSGNYNNKIESKRFSVLIDGKLRYSRWIRNKIGSMKKDIILKYYPNAIFVPQYRKRRYFYFIDTPTLNKKYYNNIKHLIQPYPKRNREVIGIIYQIKNKINNKKYVGQTIRTLIDRINDYKRGYGNDYINNAFNKYGWDNFEFTIIDTASTIDELNNKEIYYINKYNSNNKNFGYNIESGGDNKIPTIETIEKMSRSHLGIKQTNEWVNKRIANAGTEEAKKYGRRKTDIEKQELSDKSPKYWLGRERDEKTKEKISRTKKERGLSDKQKNILFKTVYKKNPKTNEILETFESTSHASTIIGVNQSTISRWCKNNKIIKGFLWTY